MTDQHIYSEEKLQHIEGLASAGLNLDKISDYLGIGRTTFWEHRKKNPEIQQRYEMGLAKAEAVIGKTLFEKAVEGDMQAIKWWEITRAGRAEKKEVEVTEKRLVVALPNPVTEDEWASEYGGEISDKNG